MDGRRRSPPGSVLLGQEQGEAVQEEAQAVLERGPDERGAGRIRTAIVTATRLAEIKGYNGANGVST